jgi:N6-adenosine-specific RNA methylase IME4
MKYRTIVADPPWPDAYRLTGVTRVGREFRERGIEAQYPTMSLAEIKSLPVIEFADTAGTHLYLWTTNLHIRESFEVLDAWGFRYKALLTWVKQGHLGLGHHWRNQTEHVLFGVLGSLRTHDRGQVNVFSAPKRGHSVKPEAFLDIVERMSPGPYLELFARRNRLGWDTWGNEALEMVEL